jgi:hypothetical protein
MFDVGKPEHPMDFGNVQRAIPDSDTIWHMEPTCDRGHFA